jgi:hypothetical protein
LNFTANGLGDATNVQAVEVLWPSGKRQTPAKELQIDRLLEITEIKD